MPPGDNQPCAMRVSPRQEADAVECPFAGMPRVLDCLDALDKQDLNAPLIDPGPRKPNAKPFDPVKLRIRDWFWRRVA
ncbi:MAG: hypothetical protein GVY16_02645 [Planctomycetes bacterium]|nr:hypothetical protein [Phycisphaerae bacterium]NBB94617.1 hypothetical protein [Planctomycetota bacterium]